MVVVALQSIQQNVWLGGLPSPLKMAVYLTDRGRFYHVHNKRANGFKICLQMYWTRAFSKSG